MKYGIVADIHSNRPALEAVLAALKAEGASEIICLGDIVGYNAEPRPCLEAISGFEHVIRGNHDRYVTGEEDERVKEEAKAAVEWTKGQITPEEINRLNQLPDQVMVENRFLLVHGSPVDRDDYILSTGAIARSLKVLKEKYGGIDICFFGHTHIPMVVGDGRILVNFRETAVVPLKRMTPYLVNCGAVGQPRDRCPLASAGVFDAATWELKIIRVPYDVGATQQKIRDAGLPERLALRLESGT